MVSDNRRLPLTARICAPGDLAPEEIAQWRALASDPDLATPFLSHAYALAAAKVFFGVRICSVRCGGETIAFFPFQFRSALHRTFGIGERIGGELSDYFGIVAKQDIAISPQDLMRLSGLSTMYFTHLDESQTRFGLGGESPRPGLRIELPDGRAAYWERRRKDDKKFVADTERRERKLIKDYGPLRFVFRESDPLPHLEHLIAAKRAQYERTGAKDSMREERTRTFLRELALCGDAACRATLTSLHAGETWIASHFGLMCGGTLHYWFPVYNPEVHSFAPGRLLVKAIIDACEENGVTCIDRGSGDAAAKRDFATTQHSFLNGLWSRPGANALIYRTGLSLRWRVARLRRRGRETPAPE
jgi:CelD/BcsL family acetyltransferase involved in cellulose biosynthesis